MHLQCPLTLLADWRSHVKFVSPAAIWVHQPMPPTLVKMPDRKSTRLNSSHLVISYAVFCLKKKNNRCFRASTLPPLSLSSCCVLRASRRLCSTPTRIHCSLCHVLVASYARSSDYPSLLFSS